MEHSDGLVPTPYNPHNPAYGGCRCPCHLPGELGGQVMHIMPCCWPETVERLGDEVAAAGSKENGRQMVNNLPRRSQLQLFTPAEQALYDALLAVEAAGAHPLLTDAVVLLQQAREKVADFVELPDATVPDNDRVLGISWDEAFIASHGRSERFPEEHICPRHVETSFSGQAVWGPDDRCSFCGSLHPEALLERLATETLVVGPTDKNYKIYLTPTESSPPLKQYCRRKRTGDGQDPSLWEWKLDDVRHGKFYFQHFDAPQQQRFVELLNEGKLHFDYPGYFYRLPFFVTRKDVLAKPAEG